MTEPPDSRLILESLERLIDCSQSPYFSVGFSRLVRFDGSAVILVCKSERDPGRVSKLPRGEGVGVSIVREGKLRYPSLGSLDTLPRSQSINLSNDSSIKRESDLYLYGSVIMLS